MKETGYSHWVYPNIGATNESGFGGLPGGNCRVMSQLGFGTPGENGFWWSSSEYDYAYAYIRSTHANTGAISGDINVLKISLSKTDGVSIRCLKD